eukprot:3341511-Prymnesium_polylepis.1
MVAVTHGCTRAASKVRVVGNGKRETGGQREVLGVRGMAASGRAVPDIVVVGGLGESVLESGLRLGVAVWRAVRRQLPWGHFSLAAGVVAASVE